jgi:hypothetical protein
MLEKRPAKCRRRARRYAVGFAALLFGCGGRSNRNDPGEVVVSQSGGAAGAAGSALTGGSPALGGSRAAGGEPPTIEPEPKPPAKIAGRWALFGFEDPVGVRLTQTNTRLVGRGCAAGAPPLATDQNFCGDVTGEVDGNEASFGFSFEGYRYQAETVISADGQRMTGRFHGVADWLESPTAWLRLPDDAAFLEAMAKPSEPEALSGWYELRLTDGAAGEYQSGVPYRFFYSRRAIQGALGAFWGTEASDPAAGAPIRVGPVPATSPELPVSLQIEFTEHGLTAVKAHAASGNAYSFSAQRAAVD